GGIPDALLAAFAVFVLLELLVEPAAVVLPGLCAEARVHFPVVARDERADALLALDQDGERRRLHATDGRLVETARAHLVVERGHRARAVDAHQPVRLGAALRRIGEREQVAIRAQAREAVADRTLRHRLQPQAPDRLLSLRVLDDVAEYQLALAPRVAGIDETFDVLALDEPQQQVQPRLASLDRRQLEARRNHRQMLERPAPGARIVLFG